VTDTVWARMRSGEYYTIRDLANASGEGIGMVARILDFLTKYGFVDRVAGQESLFRRRVVAYSLNPEETAEMLTLLVDQLVEELSSPSENH